ncbi:MAG: WxcM-like domain-containing protein [Methanomicrobium sp.]|nr:WxcM-like domain-containing protein [Methanomicrobium sp.]
MHTYAVSVAPDCFRANHYHRKKEEWIAETSGKILLSLKWIDEDKKTEIIMDSESPECRLIHIKPGVAHKLQNISDRNSSVIVFSKTPEDKEDTIPYNIN